MLREEKSKRDPRVTTWLGAKVKNIIGLGEVSAAGLPGETGVSLLEVPADSAAAKAGLQAGDAIPKCVGRATYQMSDLERRWRAASPGPVELQVWRGHDVLRPGDGDLARHQFGQDVGVDRLVFGVPLGDFALSGERANCLLLLTLQTRRLGHHQRGIVAKRIVGQKSDETVHVIETLLDRTR